MFIKHIAVPVVALFLVLLATLWQKSSPVTTQRLKEKLEVLSRQPFMRSSVLRYSSSTFDTADAIELLDADTVNSTTWCFFTRIVQTFIPKCRRKRLFGVVRKELGEVFHRLAAQKECEIEEGHVMPDRVHMLISVPPKHAVSSVVGHIKGKSAIHVARHFLKKQWNYAGQHLWVRGYFMDTVGRDTEVIRRYILNQEK